MKKERKRKESIHSKHIRKNRSKKDLKRFKFQSNQFGQEKKDPKFQIFQLMFQPF